MKRTNTEAPVYEHLCASSAAQACTRSAIPLNVADLDVVKSSFNTLY